MKDWRTLIRPADRTLLEVNFTMNTALRGTGGEVDPLPPVKLFLPWTSGTWLLSEADPDSSLAFGLCDLGMGCPELGDVCLEELCSVAGPFGLRVEQDLHWRPAKKLSEYAEDAMGAGYIRA